MNFGAISNPFTLNLLLLLLGMYCFSAAGQQLGAPASEVKMRYKILHKDSAFVAAQAALKPAFASSADAAKAVSEIAQTLRNKGFPLASVDTVYQHYDSMFVTIYAGVQFKWVALRTNSADAAVLAAAGYRRSSFDGKTLDFTQLQNLQTRLLRYYENIGYPFAEVALDSIAFTEDSMHAMLRINKGVLYHIDSLRIVGTAKLSKQFLQRYLEINQGSVFDKSKLEKVDKRIMELPYITSQQPSDITMLGSGSVLNIYAAPKKSSQVNFLVGFLPASSETNKLRLTGDVNLDLKNMFGGAEEILVKWQQLQPKSPRLNLGFTRPYIFNSAFGISFLFDLFKKDSNFLQTNAQAGLQYNLSATQSGKLFIQWQNNTLLSGAVDTNQVKFLKQLPANIDVSAVNGGIDYNWNGTNYRFNPSRGNELFLQTIVGIKNTRRNHDIINIKDPSFNYSSLYDSVKPKSYQLRMKGSVAHYFPVGKAATIKAALSGGYYNSPNIFRNELFQVGGYRLLRGFDEESIYATSYAVFTAEFRYLVGLNSYLFGFTDIGAVNNKYQNVNSDNVFTSLGLGLVFETKAGLLNVSYAIGKRDDVRFNIREASKLHFGYINYF